MIQGEFKNILVAVFDVLGFSDEEKIKALEGFKKKVAFGVLGVLQENLC